VNGSASSTNNLEVLDITSSWSTSTPAWASSSGPLVSGPNSAGGNLGYGGPNNQHMILYDGTFSSSLEVYDIASGQCRWESCR
jgi:hypothetical protein